MAISEGPFTQRCKSCRREMWVFTLEQMKAKNPTGNEICPECAARSEKVLKELETHKLQMQNKVNTVLEEIETTARQLIKFMKEPDIQMPPTKSTMKPSSKPQKESEVSNDKDKVSDLS